MFNTRDARVGAGGVHLGPIGDASRSYPPLRARATPMRQPDSLPTSPTLLRSLAMPGNEAAWTAFVDRYSPTILAQCRRAGLQAADAEEVRSRVLARLVRSLAGLSYDPARTFRGYLRTVVRNAVGDYWRERSRPGTVGSGAFGAGDLPAPMIELGEAIEEEIDARLRLIERVVARVRRTVQADTWQAYWLTAIEGREAAEVARELGKSVGAVYMAKHRVALLLAEEGAAAAGGAP